MAVSTRNNTAAGIGLGIAVNSSSASQSTPTPLDKNPRLQVVPSVTPAEKFGEDKEQKTSGDEKEQKAEPKFGYSMSAEQFIEMLKLPAEIQQKIQAIGTEFHARFKSEYIKNLIGETLAALTNLLFPTWLAKTGSSGFLLAAALLSDVAQETLKDIKWLSGFASIFVWVNAVLAGLQWLLMYLPWKVAEKSTLDAAFKEALGKATSTLGEYLEKLKNFSNHPTLDGGIEIFGVLAFEVLTKFFNASSASTEIFFAVGGATWLPAVLIIVFAGHYCAQIWDESVKKGAEFWRLGEVFKELALFFKEIFSAFKECCSYEQAAGHLKQALTHLANVFKPLVDENSLFEQIKQGNFAVAFKVFFEAWGSVIIKALTYSFIAEGNQQNLGFWAAPNTMFVWATIHGLLLNYRTAFQTNVLEPLEQLEKALLDKVGKDIDQLIREEMESKRDAAQHQAHIKNLSQRILIIGNDVTPEDKALLAKEFAERVETLAAQIAALTASSTVEEIAAVKKQILQINADFRESVMKSKGYSKLLTRDPLSLFTVVISTLFGGYAGFRVGAPALSTVMSPAVSIPLMSAIGSGWVSAFYTRATADIESKKAAAVKLNDAKEQPTTATDRLAFAIAVNGAVASALSGMGSAGSKVKDSAALVTLVLFIVSQKMINDVRYSVHSVADSLAELRKFLAACFAAEDVKKAAEPAPAKTASNTATGGWSFASLPSLWNSSTSQRPAPPPKPAQELPDESPRVVRFWQQKSAAAPISETAHAGSVTYAGNYLPF